MNRLRNSCSALFTAALLSASTSGEARSQQGTPSFCAGLTPAECVSLLVYTIPQQWTADDHARWGAAVFAAT